MVCHVQHWSHWSSWHGMTYVDMPSLYHCLKIHPVHILQLLIKYYPDDDKSPDMQVMIYFYVVNSFELTQHVYINIQVY